MSDSGMLPPFDTPRSTVEGYLEKAGWVRTGGVEELYAVWTEVDRGPSTEILVPLDETRTDYEPLYNRALSRLEELLSRQVFRDIVAQQKIETEQNLAPTTWTRQSPTPPGTIVLPAGEALHGSISRQLSSAARAAVEPMPKLGRSNAFVARDYLDHSLLAPSGAGSYVVTVLAPLHQRIFLTAPDDPKPDKPARQRRSIDASKVLQTFDQALDAISTALTAKESRDAVQTMKSAVKGGVSQELVEALADFTSGHEAAVVVPRQLWTPGSSAKEYAFQPKDTLVLMEAAEALDEEPQSTRTTVTGVVAALRHEPNSPDHTVHLFTTARGPIRRVRANLPEDDYRRATEAHAEGDLVKISGTLAKVGKFWWVQNPQMFSVLSTVEEAEEAEMFSLEYDEPPY